MYRMVCCCCVQVPELFAYGMLCALAASGLWITIATYLEFAVSTTHSSIGAVIGFALVWKGRSAVIWNDPIDRFPYRWVAYTYAAICKHMQNLISMF